MLGSLAANAAGPENGVAFFERIVLLLKSPSCHFTADTMQGMPEPTGAGVSDMYTDTVTCPFPLHSIVASTDFGHTALLLLTSISEYLQASLRMLARASSIASDA